jgi:hypothetical protein
MLKEIAAVRQDDSDLRRRWFRSDYFDLFVWESAAGEIVHFQLCYDREANERALVWKQGRGFFHDGVDTGETLPVLNQSPVFVSDGSFAARPVRQLFEREAAGLPTPIASFISAKLDEFTPAALRSRPCRKRPRRADWQRR